MINLNYVMEDVLSMLKPLSELLLEGRDRVELSTLQKSSSIDYVTEYDIKCERQLIKLIESRYPEHSILGEEGGARDKDSDYQWVIDPIDGTTNYAHGFPFFCISIGLKYRGQTVLGVVHAPMLNYTFRSIKGQGAYLNNQLISVSNTETLKRSIIGTGFPYSRETDNMNLGYFNKMINRISGIRRCGSAALDLCMVASGMLDAYWEFYLNEWDICAGVLFIEEAGGLVEQIPVGQHTMLISGNPKLFNLLKNALFE